MKTLFATLLALISFLTAMAQENAVSYKLDDEYNLYSKHEGDTAYIYADIAYIREHPSIKSNSVDSLLQGTQVFIKSNGYNRSTIRGFVAPWHKISYRKNGQQKEGYVWLGLLDLGHNSDANGNLFVHGFLRYEKETSYSPATYLLEIKGFDKSGNIISKISYPATVDGQTYSDSKILSNMGLKGLQSIHRIGVYSESCGIPTLHYYFGWTGQEFITMFEKTNVGDAGIFYHEERILFPSEHHLAADLIIKDIEEGEVIDENANEPEYKKTTSREKFLWDGKKISQLLEMKPISN